MKKTFLTAISAITLSALFLGCATTKNLDTTGVYKGDTYLYNIDSTIVRTYQVVDAFLVFETQNQAFIKTNSPEIFNVANQIRAGAPTALADVKKARDLYIKYFNSPAGNFNDVSNNLQSQVNILVAQSQYFSNIASSSPVSNSFTSILTVTTNNPSFNINTVLSTVSTNN
jgi:hypothetical protein